MKSPGVVVLSGVLREVNEVVDVSERAEFGRLLVRSTDLGRDLLRDRIDDIGFSAFAGELSSRFNVTTRLRGLDRDRLLLPSLTSPSSLFGRSLSLVVVLLALDRTSLSVTDVVEESLPLLSPLMSAAFNSGFRLRIVSRIL